MSEYEVYPTNCPAQNNTSKTLVNTGFPTSTNVISRNNNPDSADFGSKVRTVPVRIHCTRITYPVGSSKLVAPDMVAKVYLRNGTFRYFIVGFVLAFAVNANQPNRGQRTNDPATERTPRFV